MRFFSKKILVTLLISLIFNTISDAQSKKELELNLLLLKAEKNSSDSLIEAEKVTEKALKLSQTEKFPKQELHCYLLLGELKFKQSDFITSLINFEHADSLASAYLFYEQKAEALNGRGKIYNALNHLKKAEALHNQALEISTEHNLLESKAFSFKYLGNVFFQRNKSEKSRDFYQKSLALFLQSNNKIGTAEIYNNIGESYVLENQFDSALFYHFKALEIKTLSRNLQSIAISVINISDIYFKSRKFDKAIDFANQAHDLFMQIQDERGTASALYHKGKIFTFLDNYKNALDFLLEAKKLATKNEFFDLERLILTELIKLNHANNKFEATSKYSLELINLQGKKSDETNLAKISEDLADYDMLKSKQTIELLQKEKIIKEEQLAKQKLIIIGFSSLIILSIIAFFVFRRIRKQRAEAYRLLKRHTEELLMKRIELQKVKQKLDLGNKYFIEIINNIPIMIMAFESNGTIACWNKQAERLTGWNAKSLTESNNSITSIIPKYSDLGFNELINRIKDKQSETLTILCKDGNYKLLSVTAITHRPPVSNWEYWLVAIDLTETMKYQTALAREKSLLDSMINSIPDIIYYKDLNGKYLGYNKAFAKFRNFSKNFALGKAEEEISDLNLAAVSTQKDISIITKEKVIFEKQNIKLPDGNERIFLVHKLPFYDESKNVLGMLGIGKDITDQENYEKTLKEARAKAEESDRLKSAFLANMSHEIRTPLNAIVGFSELLSFAEESVEDRRNYIQYITNSAQDLIRLVNDIIDFAKIESGQLDIHLQSVSPSELLTEINQIYTGILPQKGKQNVELKYCPQINASDFKFLIDPYRLKQIISNLINNSIKFTDSGFIEFGWFFPDSQTILFYVKDTGVGIPPNKQTFIFSRFSQIKDTLDRNVGGTGLGLAITKQLTELMNGKIYVESEENVGSLFYVNFPLLPNESAAGYFDWSAINIDKNYNLLYISEFAHTYESVVSMLQLAGISTIFAGTPEHAISILKKNSIDFIINNLNTIETAELEAKLKANNFEIKTIKPILNKEFSCKKCTCIEKPFKTEDLLKAIQNLL